LGGFGEQPEYGGDADVGRCARRPSRRFRGLGGAGDRFDSRRKPQRLHRWRPSRLQLAIRQRRRGHRDGHPGHRAVGRNGRSHDHGDGRLRAGHLDPDGQPVHQISRHGARTSGHPGSADVARLCHRRPCLWRRRCEHGAASDRPHRLRRRRRQLVVRDARGLDGRGRRRVDVRGEVERQGRI
jgi:hypothetical protein